MKRCFLILAGLLCVLTISRADVIIYKQNISYTKTGAGTAARSGFTGWMLLDGQSADVIQLKLYASRGRFHVERPVDYELHNVSAGATREYMVLGFYGKGMGSLVAKGVNSNIDIWMNNNYWVPRSMTVSGTDLFVENGEAYLQEFKGSLVYDRKDTEDANMQKLTLDQTLSTLRDYLASKGYAEE
jgi:hypothetical protein